MPSLTVAYLPDYPAQSSLDDVAKRLNELPKNELLFTPWPQQYPYKPRVAFSIAHTGDSILLQYIVSEKSIRAAAGQINGAVWEDACVEFFVSFDEKGYYNFEFNCAGTALVGFGREKAGRELLPKDVIETIRCRTVIHRQKGEVHWELTAVLPAAVFTYHAFETLEKQSGKANFYKCGDALPEPHFVAWANIAAPQPNFHLPEFFGSLEFA